MLEGMSIPRVRVPELVIDMPMLIESVEDMEPNIIQDDSIIKKAIGEELLRAAKREGFTVTQAFQQRFDEELKLELAKVKSDCAERGYPREMVVRAADSAFNRTLKEEKHEKATSIQIRRVSDMIRQKALEVALKKSGKPAKVNASIISDDIKTRGSQSSVTRLRLVLKEEGLEWTVNDNQDGTTSRKLTPE